MKKNQINYKLTKKYTPEIIEEIIRIESEEGLTAENIVKNAIKKLNPLHNLFIWNDKIEAEKWRMYQARLIINEVKIVIDEKEYYAYENINVNISNEESKREYKPINEILENPKYKEQLLHRALNEVKYWKSRYEELEELTPIFETIEKFD